MRLKVIRLSAWSAIVPACLWLGSAAAQNVWPDQDREPLREPPLTLPETLRGDVRVGAGQAIQGTTIDTIRDIFPALGACWAPPSGLSRLETIEVTARFSLRRDGSLIGAPRVTFATLGAETRARQTLAEATFDAIRRCTPLRLTKTFGDAVAGRPIAIRFIYHGPKGHGV